MLRNQMIETHKTANTEVAPRRRWPLFHVLSGLACAAVALGIAAPNAQSADYLTPAALAEAAYPKKQKALYHRTLKKFPRRGKLVSHKNGFSGAIFEGRKTIYVSFAGTDDVIDIVGDAQLASWFGNNKTVIKSQIASAKGLTQKAISHNKSKKKIIVVGHSLGGYLAQVVAAEMRVSAGISLNAPGFGPKDKGKMYKPKNKSRVMVNLSRERDVVGNFGKHFGRKILYHDVMSAVNHPGNNHGITGFRKDIANGMKSFRTLVSGSSYFANKAVRSSDSKKCIQIGKPVTEGKNARIRKCNKKKWNQRWTFHKSGIMHLSSVGGKDARKPRCLEAKTSKKGTAIQVGECHGFQNQRWRFHKKRIRGIAGKFKKMCVDVKGAKNKSGTRLVLWPCHKKSNQKWTKLK
jgi:hypothetical protein